MFKFLPGGIVESGVWPVSSGNSMLQVVSSVMSHSGNTGRQFSKTACERTSVSRFKYGLLLYKLDRSSHDAKSSLNSSNMCLQGKKLVWKNRQLQEGYSVSLPNLTVYCASRPSLCTRKYPSTCTWIPFAWQ